MSTGPRYIRTQSESRTPGPQLYGLGDFCLDPWSHELKCFGLGSAHDQFTEALTKAKASGRLPSACASKIDVYMQKAIDGDDWSALSGSEYQWLNRAWRGLLYNDLDPPGDCLAAGTNGETFQPGEQWTPPPGDPQPPVDVPWGWIGIGAGVVGLWALYWFVLRKKPKKKT